MCKILLAKLSNASKGRLYRSVSKAQPVQICQKILLNFCPQNEKRTQYKSVKLAIMCVNAGMLRFVSGHDLQIFDIQ